MQHFKILQTQNDQQETVLTMSATSAAREMDGLYYCSAENKAGKVERVGHLTVQCEWTPPSPLYLLEYLDVVIQCLFIFVIVPLIFSSRIALLV